MSYKKINNNYGEMYLFENSTATTIEAVDQWHPAYGFTDGDLKGWTFDAGSKIDILSFADYSGTVAGTIKATTDGAHGFTTGDPVSLVGANIAIGGANEYAGVYNITVVDDDEFYFTNANWNATTTAAAILPSRIICGADAAGEYRFNGTASFTSAANSKVYDFRLFVNYTGSEKSAARFQAKNATEWSYGAGSCIVSISVGDVIWFGIMGITDDANLTIRHGNLNMLGI